jgi:hypothetical protein
MERLELAIAGVEQALRRPSGSRTSQRAVAVGSPAGGTVVLPAAEDSGPEWLQHVRGQLPRLIEALRAEHPEAGDHALTARARRLTAERNRLVRRLHQLAPALSDGCLDTGTDPERLRVTLLRLVHDIAHHHQRVNDLVYDAGWRDVGGSE